MKKFSQWMISEAISASSTEAVNKIIQSFLAKKLGTKIYRYPGVEEFTNSTGRGYGVRYFYKNKSVRFNWKGANINAFTLDSIDFWDGTSKDPNWHMDFDSQMSLVKTLPTVVDFALSPYGTGSFYIFPDDDKLSEENLHEAAFKKGAFEILIKALVPNKAIPPIQHLKNTHGDEANGLGGVFRQVRSQYPNLFSVSGKTITFIGTEADIKTIASQSDTISKNSGGVKVTVSAGGRNENYAPNEQERKIESEGVEKIAYEEQLKHLAVLLKLVAKGSSNALFVAGRGGTGKTQTIETELAKLGLQDGDGYFKNTGSASPIGIYTCLYDNRSGIVLFDDCDSALNDQEGRNLIKAATDTKKYRKVSWNKKSSVIVPRDQYESAEEAADGERPTDKNGSYIYPNSFEFSGRVIFISNLTLDKLDPDGALRTRGFIIDINPTDAELIDYMAKIAPNIRLENGTSLKQSEIDDVVKVIKASKSTKDVSLRKLVRGLNVKSEMRDDAMCEIIIKLYA